MAIALPDGNGSPCRTMHLATPQHLLWNGTSSDKELKRYDQASKFSRSQFNRTEAPPCNSLEALEGSTASIHIPQRSCLYIATGKSVV